MINQETVKTKINLSTKETRIKNESHFASLRERKKTHP